MVGGHPRSFGKEGEHVFCPARTGSVGGRSPQSEPVTGRLRGRKKKHALFSRTFKKMTWGELTPWIGNHPASLAMAWGNRIGRRVKGKKGGKLPTF